MIPVNRLDEVHELKVGMVVQAKKSQLSQLPILKVETKRMKHLAFFVGLCLLPVASLPQVVTAVPCDEMSLVVNVGSNLNSISIYHPGGYLTWPGESNVMAWEFMDGAGNVIHEEVLVDNSFVSFGFDLPLTDTLFVSVLLTNEDAMLGEAPVACLIEDLLVREIDTWPVSGEQYGTWTLGGSVGVDANCPVQDARTLGLPITIQMPCKTTAAASRTSLTTPAKRT